MSRRGSVKVRRIYDDVLPEDGARVLVDRIWPRGVSKARAQLDEWCKQVAPSTALRKWYSHDPQRFAEFRRRYQTEQNLISIRITCRIGKNESGSLDDRRIRNRRKRRCIIGSVGG